MAQTLTVAGKLAAGFEDGSTTAPIDLAISFTYLNRVDFERDYAAPVTDEVIDFGTLAAAGAKGVLIKCKAGACTIKFDADTYAWPLAPGGYFLWHNPSTPMPKTAKISTTGPAHVVFLAVG